MKREYKKRDPDMHQTRKGNQWYFGMKTHIGVDSKTKLIHSVAVAPANCHDSQVLSDLLHGDETQAWGDSACSGQRETIKQLSPQAKDFTNKKGSRYKSLTDRDCEVNRQKSKVRSQVEQVFSVLKRQFGYNKIRYRGLDKNPQSVFTKCALIKLYLVKQQLLTI